MNIQKDFTKSVNGVIKTKKLIFPFMISLLIPAILLVAFLSFSGAYDAWKDYSQLSSNYRAEKREAISHDVDLKDKEYLTNLMQYLQGPDTDNKDFMRYLNEKGFSFGKFTGLFNRSNLLTGIALIVISIVFSLYIGSVANLAVAAKLKNQEINFSIITQQAFGFMPRLLLLIIFSGFLVLLPIFAGVALVIISFVISNLLGALLLIVFILATFAYVILISVKLTFSVPIMFLSGASAIDSVSGSLKLTKKSFKNAFFVAGISFVIGVVGSFVSNPLQNSFANLIMLNGIIGTFLYFILSAVLLVAYSFILAISSLFIFHSFVDYRATFHGKNV
ncbi:hypothetical protein JXA85_03535 [Candidatus Woesearchaeota archaeon]|nr:hypothetical protein [Candidatus Woesearchaeota archaeon]